MRGKHISRPADELVKEAANLAKNGTKELVLIAQDLTFYGLDITGKRDLAELLRKLSDVNGIDWIRLQYAYPSQFPLDALDVMAERSNICKYLDMPLQHGSDAMLKSMRRGITKRRTLRQMKEHHVADWLPSIKSRQRVVADIGDAVRSQVALTQDEDRLAHRLGNPGIDPMTDDVVELPQVAAIAGQRHEVGLAQRNVAPTQITHDALPFGDLPRG